MAYSVDASSGLPIPRKSQKFHWIYSLAALSFHPARLRTIADFQALSFEEQAKFLEWLVAQEIWRKAAIAGTDMPEIQYFWQSNKAELDFRLREDMWLEVKRGKVSPSEFSWFLKVFPKAKLTVVSGSGEFQYDFLRGISFENFLL